MRLHSFPTRRSSDLLDDSERRLFARLGAFAAGFSLEAAETVCADDAAPPVLDGIASLVDKSLLRTEDPLHGQPRFTMLQVVRDFALEQLDALGGRSGSGGRTPTTTRASSSPPSRCYGVIRVR